MQAREKKSPSTKEIDKMFQLLNKQLNLELQKKIKETEAYIKESVLKEKLTIPTDLEAIKEVAKRCTIDIPIDVLNSSLERFSEEELEAIERVRTIKKDFKLTQEELSRILGVSLRTIAGWLHSESGPRPLAQEKISKVYEVHQEATEIMRSESLREWLFAENKLLEDNIYNLLLKGEYREILADIEALKEGVYV